MTWGLEAGTDLVEYGRELWLSATPPTRPSATEYVTDDAIAAELAELLEDDARPVSLRGWTTTPLVTPIAAFEPVPLEDLASAAEVTPVSRGVSASASLGAGRVRTATVAPFRPAPQRPGWGPVRPRRNPELDVEGSVSEIRAITGLSVAEFTDLLGRSRERYYAWRRGHAPAEIVARIAALRDALSSPASEPAHLVRAWLRADGGAAMKLLAGENYPGFAAAAQDWLASRRPPVARRVSPDEIAALTAEHPSDDEEERLAHFKALMTARSTSPHVAKAPNFYRDVLDSASDDDE